ncbi:hypothetical protein LTR37_001690 [Vermiconidia calcicola]|uniref:Uncharacterized protein n=1 Tax=Vermiconidia calcicola TaxID=1690605 RepID=A0ACC3NUT3_9PEZI|nr:hypothetical protein LTR37_001690 [Vermiconidia calcicola]
MNDNTAGSQSTSARTGASRPPPPPLPPRQQSSSSAMSPYAEPPPTYDAVTTEDIKGPWSSQDRRTSSTQSLVPSETNVQNERRKLLLVYIHGFMGNETSFRSFPAHVHNLLTVLLKETHVVHTKVYPRYRSKNKMMFARDGLSQWLEPHADEKTDIVLLGHSMGGLLCAELVLMPPEAPASRPLKHRILGTINFDVPFLGMHPGVVKSGLASIFKSDEPPGDQWTDAAEVASPSSSSAQSIGGRSDTLWSPQGSDPNYNPSFNNDVVLPMRKGWQNAWHFMNKHSGDIFKATKKLVTSHMEFGGAMANYPELKVRYGRIRALEEEDERVRKSVLKSSQPPPRVRFVNYYTASTGRTKKAESSGQGLLGSANASTTSLTPSAAEDSARGRHQRVAEAIRQHSRSKSPRISLEEHSDDGVVQKVPAIPESDDENWVQAAETLTIAEPENNNTFQSNTFQRSETMPMSEDDGSLLSPSASISTTATMPPIPDLPAAPPPLDLSYIQDPNVRKLVEKEHARAVKSYEKAVKEREKAVKDRAKLEEKRERKSQRNAEKASKDAQKAKEKSERDTKKVGQKVEDVKEMTQSQKEELRLQQERQRMEAEGRRMRGEKTPDDEEFMEPPWPEYGSARTPPELVPRTPPESVPVSEHLTYLRSASASASDRSRSRSRSPDPKSQKPRKDRMFCMLPPKDSSGQRDPAWVRVFMENVDEVGAHCGLFFVDERYERLVGEIADRIEHWVKEENDARMLRAYQNGGEYDEDWDLD